jgi:hypothetical protein
VFDVELYEVEMALRNLVVLRCGDQSLHSGWLHPSRNWALAISYFGADQARTFPEAQYVRRYVGGKWDGIYDFFAARPELLEQFEYFWLPDDDIAAEPHAIGRMFQLVRANGFELAQPSLSADSYLSHLISLSNPWFEHRFVNLVEIMVPVVHRDFLKRVLPLFKTSKTGFGFDFVWHRFTTDPRTRVAILDAVQVTHTRPVGGALHAKLKQDGATTAQVEERAFLAPYGNVQKHERVSGGRLRLGMLVNRPKLAATLAAMGWATKPSGKRGFAQPLSRFRFILWVIRNWLGNFGVETPFSRLQVISSTAKT